MSLLSVNIKEEGYEKSEMMIHQIRFSIEKGELIGLIGANGAGKSTTIKAIQQLLPFYEGEIKREQNFLMSYIPERPVFYDDLTLQEHIDFVAAVEEITDEMVSKRITSLLNQFKMKDHVHELPATYSKGMQQKAMIILALMTEPDVLIIDEPFIGLDPMATKLLLELIQHEKERGVGILMCTHVLDTAEKICDRFLLIDQGRLVADGTLEDFQQKSRLPNGALFDCFHAIITGDSHE
ncbi:ABC transporter ATP-binding protein [Bacillus massiliigorillae]|uniref:ABC transporter ATP-binding protein n=1 Tax=Bacillus massiliigorillae TaxID=1243664 RepID=UPI00039D2D0B|nr:ABC transporter ATP-binding protein [Bacillus massiliigorillae]